MKITIRQITEFLGVAAVVLSLLFVGFELRQSRSIAESEGFQENHELTRSLSELIIANADVWERGCMAEDLTAKEAIVFSRIVHSLIDFEWTRWTRASIGISNAPPRIGARPLARHIYNFPGIKASWDTTPQKGSQLFQQTVYEEYELLVESNVERHYDVSLCGI